MLALANPQAEQARFDELAEVCGVEADGETRFCSRSCEELGRHFLIYPEPTETYDEVLARARVEAV